MKTNWYQGLKADERDNFRQEVLRSKKVLDKLAEIVYNMSKYRAEVSFDDYDSPSWSHKQAHTNGYNEAIRQVIELLTLKDAHTNG